MKTFVVIASVASVQMAMADAADLEHLAPLRYAVSSVVPSARISPYDLVDGNLGTAWKSEPGDLHAWVAIRVPPEATAEAIQLTVGFTGNGPEGDYFTRNHRIKRVRLSRNGVVLGEHDLDVNSRALQTIPIASPANGDFRIEVVATQPGTDPASREVCISELRVLGTITGKTGQATFPPTLAIGSLDHPDANDTRWRPYRLERVESLDSYCQIYRPEHTCTRAAGPKLDRLPPGWRATWISVEGRGKSCELAIRRAGMLYVTNGLAGENCGASVDLGTAETPLRTRFEATVADAIPGGDPELVLVLTSDELDPGARSGKTVPHYRYEHLVICTVMIDSTIGCTSPLEVGFLQQVLLERAAPWERRWTARHHLDGGLLVIEPGAVKPGVTPDEFPSLEPRLLRR